MKRRVCTFAVMAILAVAVGAPSADQPGESGALGERLEQETVVGMNINQARVEQG